MPNTQQFDKETPTSSTPNMMEQKQNSDDLILTRSIMRLRLSQLRAESLEDDLLVLEMREDWTQLNEGQKIRRAVADADHAMAWEARLKGFGV